MQVRKLKQLSKPIACQPIATWHAIGRYLQTSQSRSAIYFPYCWLVVERRLRRLWMLASVVEPRLFPLYVLKYVKYAKVYFDTERFQHF